MVFAKNAFALDVGPVYGWFKPGLSPVYVIENTFRLDAGPVYRTVQSGLC